MKKSEIHFFEGQENVSQLNDHLTGYRLLVRLNNEAMYIKAIDEHSIILQYIIEREWLQNEYPKPTNRLNETFVTHTIWNICVTGIRMIIGRSGRKARK